jgi:hypothetical protein
MHILQNGSAKTINLVAIASIIALLAIAVSMLPKGFSDDLSKIGKGSNIAVLIHNKNAIQSLNLMDRLNRIRTDYENKIEFLVVDIETEEGKQFTQEQNLTDIGLVFFGPNGARQGILSASNISDDKGLRRSLDNQFAFKP